jgi:hypothetical protein
MKEEEAGMEEKLIPLSVVAERTGVALRTLEDRKWRARIGLPVVKLGGKVVGVRADDLAAVLRREFTPEPTAAA